MTPIFENEHFLVIDKRAGFLSVPSRMGKDDPRPCELVEWSQSRGILSPIHRLDEEVTGILMYGKSKEGHREANLWFENRVVRKTYEALTEAKEAFPKANESFLWKSKLLRGKKRAYEKPFGKLAITNSSFKKTVEHSGQTFGYWVLSPETGRSHQLRYELFKHGFPVVGDVLYGASSKFFVDKAIGLRAVSLSFHDCPHFEKFGLPEKFELDSILKFVR